MYRRKNTPGGGTLSSRGSLEPCCPWKIFACIYYTGLGAQRCQEGTWGMMGLSSLRCWFPGPSPGVSVNLYTIHQLLYTEGGHPCLGGKVSSAAYSLECLPTGLLGIFANLRCLAHAPAQPC
jgi:hypothetical protein